MLGGIEWGEFEKMKVSVAPLNGRQSVENNRKDAKVRGAWLAQSHESKKRDAIEKQWKCSIQREKAYGQFRMLDVALRQLVKGRHHTISQLPV